MVLPLYVFTCEIVKDCSEAELKKGDVIYPYGFYYLSGRVILVGDSIKKDTVKRSFPVDCVNITVIKR